MEWQVVIPVFVALIAASVAVAGALIANSAQSAYRRQVDIFKISDFRYDWLVKLRDTLGKCLSLMITVAESEDPQIFERLHVDIQHSIIDAKLLLKTKDDGYNALVTELDDLMTKLKNRSGDFDATHALILSQSVLDRGWSGLKEQHGHVGRNK